MKTKKMVLMGLFIALSFVGANFKIMGTIAFDSLPAFLGTLLLGPMYGAVIGALGHLLTAATSGFPLTVPVHMIVMVDMALTMYVFGVVYRKLSKRNEMMAYGISIVVAVLLNGPVSVAMVAPFLIPMMGVAGLLSLLIPLSTVAALNVILAATVHKLLPSPMKVGDLFSWK